MINEEIKDELTFNQFKTYYKQQIFILSKQLSSILSSILGLGNKNIININIVETGTKISYRNETIKKDSFVEHVEEVSLDIGYREILFMYHNSDFSFFDGFNKLATHEFLHVLLGDFTKEKLNRCYNFNNGTLKEDDELKLSAYYPGVNKNNKNIDSFDEEGYTKINPKIYNIASDFVINKQLDIKYPFLRAEDFKLPDNLTVYEYYSIILNDDELRSKIESRISGDVFILEDITSEFGSEMDKVPLSYNKVKKISHEDNLEDLFIGKLRGLGPSSIELVIKSLEKKNSIFISKTKEIIAKIKSDMYNIQDIPTSKTESWFKYNNRKDSLMNNIIVPGKVFKEDPLSKTTHKKSLPVIFVDCSASMMDIIKELFYFCYNLLLHINCTIVFYDTRILKVISSVNNMNFNPSMFMGGGTNVKAVIEEYKKEYNKNINNIYIFSDGEDDFVDIDIKNVGIFIFDKKGIRNIKV